MRYNVIGKCKKNIVKIFSFFRQSKNSTSKFNSKDYWNNRYLKNGNSGSGSYENLAQFKAEIINNFVESYNVKSVIELGCGDGNQLKYANYKEYKGFDVSTKAIEICRANFIKDKSKRFLDYSEIKKAKHQEELVLSLDVIFHLIEDEVFNEYMKDLFTASSKYVIIYSCNYNKKIAAHVKCRKFTDWIHTKYKNEFKLIKYIPNRFPFDEKLPNSTSFSNFYIYEREILI